MALPAAIRMLRPRQWLKNLFVLAPAFFAGRILEREPFLRALAAAALFSLLSSAAYLFNDILDVEKDRLRPAKRNRPLAAGEIGPRPAAVAAALLAAASLAGAAFLSVPLAAAMGAYALLNVLYSLGLKKVALLDVLIISSGFLLRLYGGAAAIPVPLSNWIMLTTFFLTLFLGFCKRWTEYHGEGREARDSLREYTPQMLSVFIGMSGVLAISSYALYVIRADSLGGRGGLNLLTTVPLVLLGLFRYVMVVFRDGGEGDVSEILVKDRFLAAVVVLWIALTGYFYLAS